MKKFIISLTEEEFYLVRGALSNDVIRLQQYSKRFDLNMDNTIHSEEKFIKKMNEKLLG